MSDLVRQDDHRGDGLGKLLAQFKGMPRIEALLGAFLYQIQKIEDVLFAMYTERWIDTSFGVNLDVIGRVVGEERQGITDEGYRAFLRARVRANRSTGLLAELVQILALIQGDELPVRADEYYPAGLELEAEELAAADPVRIGKMLKDATPAAVGIRYVYLTAPRAGTFMWDYGMNSGALTASQCLANGQNDPPTDGGVFAGVYG